jgi:ornithine decarboxylase
MVASIHFEIFSFTIANTLSKLLVNVGTIKQRIDLWKRALPSVTPFYAIKCNNLAPVVRTLKESGSGFDCASSDEFERAKGSSIIYANPCKSRSELQKANDAGIQYVTFDSPTEIRKIYEMIPNAKPILRVHVDDKGGARIPLNKKFGMAPQFVESLCNRFPIYGLAFHVGSDCRSTDSYQSAFQTVRQFLTLLGRNSGFKPELLDIGGGFSGNPLNDSFFENKVAPLVKKEVENLPFQRVIAEPGRFFAEECCTLQVEVIGRKTLPDGTESITINDSVYGTFSGVLFDGFKPQFKCLTQTEQHGLKQFTIFGRTCDSADRIAEKVWLPSNITEGDIVEVPSIGAYSYVSSSEFNGFPRCEVQELL